MFLPAFLPFIPAYLYQTQWTEGSLPAMGIWGSESVNMSCK
jgi:hypothetical protein